VRRSVLIQCRITPWRSAAGNEPGRDLLERLLLLLAALLLSAGRVPRLLHRSVIQLHSLSKSGYPEVATWPLLPACHSCANAMRPPLAKTVADGNRRPPCRVRCVPNRRHGLRGHRGVSHTARGAGPTFAEALPHPVSCSGKVAPRSTGRVAARTPAVLAPTKLGYFSTATAAERENSLPCEALSVRTAEIVGVV
jgi:hypothetical protein